MLGARSSIDENATHSIFLVCCFVVCRFPYFQSFIQEVKLQLFPASGFLCNGGREIEERENHVLVLEWEPKHTEFLIIAKMSIFYFFAL